MTELADRVDEQRHNIESVSRCTVPLNLATAAPRTAMLMPIRTTTPMPSRLHVHPTCGGQRPARPVKWRQVDGRGAAAVRRARR